MKHSQNQTQERKTSFVKILTEIILAQFGFLFLQVNICFCQTISPFPLLCNCSSAVSSTIWQKFIIWHAYLGCYWNWIIPLVCRWRQVHKGSSAMMKMKCSSSGATFSPLTGENTHSDYTPNSSTSAVQGWCNQSIYLLKIKSPFLCSKYNYMYIWLKNV